MVIKSSNGEREEVKLMMIHYHEIEAVNHQASTCGMLESVVAFQGKSRG